MRKKPREETESRVIRNPPKTDRAQRDWDHQKLLSVFAGLLVVVGLIYGVTTIFPLRSMNEQARAMAQQLEIMKGEIDDSKLTRSADLILRFDERLGRQAYPKLESTIASGKPILKAHGGKFSEDDLEEYLGIFDSLNDLYEKGMINKDLFYNEYSYDAVKLYDDAEVQSYLKDIRKEEADYYIGVDNLANQMKVYANPALRH
jgi:hypothetical protein